jgi:cytochrome c biogenesis protein CcdA
LFTGADFSFSPTKMTSDKTTLGALSRSIYPFAVALAVFPFVDMAGRLLPLHLGNTQWRFGAFGLVLGGTLVMMMLGLAVLAFVAALRENRWILTVIAVFSGVMALLTFGVIVVFGLDAIQLRAMARPELKEAFIRSAVVACVAGVLCVVGFASVALAAFRARRLLRSRRPEVRQPPLVATPIS